jgi:hypothetical protein
VNGELRLVPPWQAATGTDALPYGPDAVNDHLRPGQITEDTERGQPQILDMGVTKDAL